MVLCDYRWAAIGPRVGMLVSRVSAVQESPTADGGGGG